MMHMMLDEQPIATDQACFPQSAYYSAVSTSPKEIYSFPAETARPTTQDGNCGQQPSTGTLIQEAVMRRSSVDNVSSQRFRPYPAQRPPTYTMTTSPHSMQNAREELYRYGFEPTSPLHNEQHPVSSYSMLPGNIDSCQKDAEETMRVRNCNNNNINAYPVNPTPITDHSGKVTNSYTPVYNPNLVYQQNFGQLTYTSTVGPTYFRDFSASGLTNHQLRRQGINMSSSPDSYANEGKETKKRGTKKRKKKGSSEPQRPVSAYALFFRDTQAAIKAENSSATFGEISKIVASMWDSLSEEDKQVYKQKTETAKRDYLKHLAAFRANMISRGSLDAEEEDSQPLSVLREKMAEQRATTSSPVQLPGSSNVIDLTGSRDNEIPPPPKLQLAPGVSSASLQMEPQLKLHPLPPSAVPPNLAVAPQNPSARPISPVATLTKIIVPGQNGGQSTIHLINAAPPGEATSVPASSPLPTRFFICPTASGAVAQSASTISPSPPPTIQLRNIATQQPRSPITILPSKPGQIIKVVPSGAGGVTFANINPESVKGRVVRMVDIVRPVQATSPAANVSKRMTEPMPATQEQTPILQLLTQESTGGFQQHSSSPSNMPMDAHPIMGKVDDVDGTELMRIPQQNLMPLGQLTAQLDLTAMDIHNQNENNTPRRCVRDGCTNLAVSCPYWDNEYCSNECVYSHCRDVFDAWVSTRQVTTSAV